MTPAHKHSSAIPHGSTTPSIQCSHCELLPSAGQLISWSAFTAFFLLIALSYQGKAQSLQNGDFESGSTSWILSGGAEATSYAKFQHLGSMYLWLGGVESAKDLAYQIVSIPANATSAKLSFFYNINSLEGNTTAFDTFSATIRKASPDNTILKSLNTWSNKDQHGGPGNPYYQQSAVYDLLEFAGNTISICFASTNDVSEVTNFRVDDVMLVIETQELLPNLTLYIPPNWTHALIVTDTTTSRSRKAEFAATDTIFANWSFANSGAADIRQAFSTRLFVDDNPVNTWSTATLQANYYFFAGENNYSLGTLPAGDHVIRVVTDAYSEVGESDESDNELRHSISVSSGPRYQVVSLRDPEAGGNVVVLPLPGDDGKYPSGSTVELQATATPGYRFLLWQGDASGTTDRLTIEVNSAKTITAVFQRVDSHPSFSLIARAEAMTLETSTTVETRSTWQYIVAVTHDMRRWFLARLFRGNDSINMATDPINTSEAVHISKLGVVPFNDSGLSLKLPLPAGKSWLLTTEIGDQGCNGSAANPKPSHTGSNYFSLDFDNISSTDGGPRMEETNVEVLAAAGGVVVVAAFSAGNPANGYHVVIDHDFNRDLRTGYQTRYLHLKGWPDVEEGEIVVQGQPLGIVGSTGTDGDHLHFGVRFKDNGSYEDTDTRIALQKVRLEDLTLEQYIAECANGSPIRCFPSTNVKLATP